MIPSDDLISRLREQYERMGFVSLREAADEIERLRAERDKYRRLSVHLEEEPC